MHATFIHEWSDTKKYIQMPQESPELGSNVDGAHGVWCPDASMSRYCCIRIALQKCVTAGADSRRCWVATVADGTGCCAVIDWLTVTVVLMRWPPASLIVVFHGRRAPCCCCWSAHNHAFQIANSICFYVNATRERETWLTVREHVVLQQWVAVVVVVIVAVWRARLHV